MWRRLLRASTRGSSVGEEASTPAHARAPLLRLVGVLLDTTRRVPLSTPHADVLWGPVAQCAEHRSRDTRLAAYDALAGMQPATDAYAAASARAVADLLAPESDAPR